MKRTSTFLALLFGAMLLFSPAGAQQKTRLNAENNGVEMKMDKTISTLERMSVAQDLKTADISKHLSISEKISVSEMVKHMDFNLAAEKLSSPRPVAKAGETPVLRIINPVQDTVYSETNTPTFEFAVDNLEEGAGWGLQEGKYFVEMLVLNRSTGAYLADEYLTELQYTTPALPQDSYRVGFFLCKVVSGKGQLIGQAIVDFTIRYGNVAKDPAFAIVNPAEDTVYTRTSQPKIQAGIGNTTAKWGQSIGDALLIAMIYTPAGQPLLNNYLIYAGNAFYCPELPKGQYIIQCYLGVMTVEGVDFWYNSFGERIYDDVVIGINYEHPSLIVVDPESDTTYKLTRTPTFKLDVTGDNVEFGEGVGKAAIQMVVYDANENAVCLTNSFNKEVSSLFRFEDGNYTATFLLAMQTEKGLSLWPVEGGNSPQIGEEVDFTIAYEGTETAPVLTVKNPDKDTIYNETRMPSFELELSNGEGIIFGTQVYSGAPVIAYEIYNRDSLAKNPQAEPVTDGYSLNLTPSVDMPLAKGDYKVVFNLYQIGYNGYFFNWPAAGDEGISASSDFTINYTEPDPEFSMKNPAQDTVYAETNTPTFEVSVANGEKLVWGDNPDNNAMMIQLYTEEAYNSTQRLPFFQDFVADTTFSVTRALPQGKYYGVFSLMTVSQEEGRYNYVKNIAGENISAEVAFTIAYGTTNDTMLVMKNPAKDTVYSETNTPTFEVSVINGENLVWGTTVGKNVVMMEVYTKEAYNANGDPIVQEFLADTVFSISQPLPKGEYRATFNLMAVAEKAGYYYYINNFMGRVQANVNFTIDYGNVRNPALVLLDPAKDTVYAETTTPTFVLSLDKGGNDITLNYGAGNAAIMIEIFKQGEEESLLEDFFIDTTYSLRATDALDTGNYNVKFTLMQWVDETHLYYWPATERVTAQVNIRVTCVEKPEKMIAPTDLSTRTHQDTVWFSWTSKEEVYQLYVTDASGKEVKNVAVDADLEDTITTVQITKFAEGTYKWQLRAVVTDDAGKILDYSDWAPTQRFTVKYDVPEPPVSVEDNLLAGVNVYPNPTMGEFTVSVPVDAMVEIYAANGRRVVARMVVAGTETFTLETSGMYFIRVAANGKTAVQRIVVR